MNVAGINLSTLCHHVADDRPKTAGEAQLAGGPLLREPSKPKVRRSPVNVDLDGLFHDAQTVEEFDLLCTYILGKEEMAISGGQWRRRAEVAPEKLRRVMGELRVMRQQGLSPRNPGALAEELWKEFQ